MAELLVSLGIVVVLFGVITLVMSRAQGAFLEADASIDVRNQLRTALEKLGVELRQSGYDSSSVAQFTTTNGGGAGSSDLLTFSIPVLCVSTMTTILNSSGDPAYWGAPLTWGCTASSCMDANNSCSTLEYKFIRYERNSSSQLVREILNAAGTQTSSVVIAQNISDFQVSINGHAVTVTITGSKLSAAKRTMTISIAQTIMVNNYGT